MSTLTVNPDAVTGLTTVDGPVARIGVSDADWATIRAGAGNFNRTSSATDYIWYYVGKAGGILWDSLLRGIATFDTSPLGSGATISAATLSYFGSSKLNGAGDGGTTNIYTSTPAANNNLANADYGQLGSTAQCDTAISYASWSNTAYNDFLFNATGLSNISKTGVSKFGTREVTHDVANVAPANSTNETSITVVEADNGSNKPKLVITYTAVTSKPNLMPLLGIA
jgi:hypothetical protein